MANYNNAQDETWILGLTICMRKKLHNQYKLQLSSFSNYPKFPSRTLHRGSNCQKYLKSHGIILLALLCQI